LQTVAELLNGHEIGDGVVARAAREAQWKYFGPPDLGRAPLASWRRRPAKTTLSARAPNCRNRIRSGAAVRTLRTVRAQRVSKINLLLFGKPVPQVTADSLAGGHSAVIGSVVLPSGKAG
jgi:hypothetical protein